MSALELDVFINVTMLHDKADLYFKVSIVDLALRQ